MPIIEEIHVNDIGTVFRVTLYDGSSVLNVSSATTLDLIFEKPSGAQLTKPASLTDDGTDGQIEYLTVDGDLNEAGKWRWQGYVVLPSGSWKTNVLTFRVHENI